MSYMPDMEHVSKRLKRIWTFAQLHEEMGKWIAARPLRGEMKVMVKCTDDDGEPYYVGMLGVEEATIRSDFFPDLDIMRLKGEE